MRFNPGHLNPNIVRPAGPIDPEVGIVLLKRQKDKKATGAVVSFALHLDTTGGTTKYSADFPKVVEDYLQKTRDSNFSLLFGAGTCGDINHVDVTIKTRRKTEEIGTILGTTIEKQIPELKPIRQVSLAVRGALVNAPLQTFTDEQIARARKDMERVDDSKLSFLERVNAYKTLAVQLRKGTTLPMEVQVFRLSRDVAIVTLPGEVFVDLGIAIKQASRFKTTLVIELTNDGPGYIPTRKGFAEGSYETVNSRIKPGGGERMVATAVRLLKELARLLRMIAGSALAESLTFSGPLTPGYSLSTTDGTKRSLRLSAGQSRMLPLRSTQAMIDVSIGSELLLLRWLLLFSAFQQIDCRRRHHGSDARFKRRVVQNPGNLGGGILRSGVSIDVRNVSDVSVRVPDDQRLPKR